MIKIIVACADYPRPGNMAMQYVHVRNKNYVRQGIDVLVLNFSQEKDYVYEGIRVVSLKTIKNNITDFHDRILICHAPNVRNHYHFIRKYGDAFKDIIFFFHGHEIVEQLKKYPESYEFNKKGIIKKSILFIYDKFKILIWRRYFIKINKASKLIFVSNCLKNEFLENIKCNYDDIYKRISVINNSVGEVFEIESYDEFAHKEYDYITIRSNIDSSVYCIDLICQIAEQNPQKKFLLIGKGEYFKYNKRPKNLEHINSNMEQEALIIFINKSKNALMPTRRDSQGVMSCELATFGINLITSDLPVCQEMFCDFENVIMLSNAKMLDSLKFVFPNKSLQKNRKFFSENTIKNEIELIKDVWFKAVND